MRLKKYVSMNPAGKEHYATIFRAATGVLINIAQKQKLQNIDQNICNIDHTAL